MTDLLHHAMVYSAGIEYGVAGLEKLARDNFIKSIKANPKPWSTTVSADKQTSHVDMFDTIRFIFQNTLSRSDPLRLEVVMLMADSGWRIDNDDRIYELTSDVPDFGAAYMRHTMRNHAAFAEIQKYLRGSTSWQCASCHKVCRLAIGARPYSCPLCFHDKLGKVEDSTPGMLFL